MSTVEKYDHDPEELREHAHLNKTTRPFAVDQPLMPESHLRGFEDLQTPRIHLLRLFGRIERFAGAIDEAFSGQPFLPNLAPDAPANRRRFKVFLEEHRQVMKLFGQALELWMITCGLKLEDDWVPLLIEDMRLRAR